MERPEKRNHSADKDIKYNKPDQQAEYHSRSAVGSPEDGAQVHERGDEMPNQCQNQLENKEQQKNGKNAQQGINQPVIQVCNRRRKNGSVGCKRVCRLKCL